MSQESEEQTDRSGRLEDRTTHEHQVVAFVETANAGIREMRTSWNHDPHVAAETLKALQESGHSAEVNSRKVHSTVDPEEIP